jgi:predicted nucleotidyltransferase
VRTGRQPRCVFGSVARGEARPDRDIDVLFELDRERQIGILGYARQKLFIGELHGGTADVVNRRTLKPSLRDNILRDAIGAF